MGEAAKKLQEEKILRRYDTLIRVSAQTAPNHRELLDGALDQRKPSTAYQSIEKPRVGLYPMASSNFRLHPSGDLRWFPVHPMNQKKAILSWV